MHVVRIAWVVGALGVGLGAMSSTAAAHTRALQAPTLPDTNAIPPDMVTEGRKVFHSKGMCLACHGSQLEGGPIAPTLKAHAWRDAKNGELANIFFVATHGVPGTIMVAFPGGISKTEAVAVVSYVWSVGQGKVKP